MELPDIKKYSELNTMKEIKEDPTRLEGQIFSIRNDSADTRNKEAHCIIVLWKKSNETSGCEYCTSEAEGKGSLLHTVGQIFGLKPGDPIPNKKIIVDGKEKPLTVKDYIEDVRCEALDNEVGNVNYLDAYRDDILFKDRRGINWNRTNPEEFRQIARFNPDNLKTTTKEDREKQEYEFWNRVIWTLHGGPYNEFDAAKFEQARVNASVAANFEHPEVLERIEIVTNILAQKLKYPFDPTPFMITYSSEIRGTFKSTFFESLAQIMGYAHVEELKEINDRFVGKARAPLLRIIHELPRSNKNIDLIISHLVGQDKVAREVKYGNIIATNNCSLTVAATNTLQGSKTFKMEVGQRRNLLVRSLSNNTIKQWINDTTKKIYDGQSPGVLCESYIEMLVKIINDAPKQWKEKYGEEFRLPPIDDQFMSKYSDEVALSWHIKYTDNEQILRGSLYHGFFADHVDELTLRLQGKGSGANPKKGLSAEEIKAYLTRLTEQHGKDSLRDRIQGVRSSILLGFFEGMPGITTHKSPSSGNKTFRIENVGDAEKFRISFLKCVTEEEIPENKNIINMKITKVVDSIESRKEYEEFIAAIERDTGYKPTVVHKYRFCDYPKERTAFMNMNDRCYKDTGKQSNKYKTKGIEVCDEWKSIAYGGDQGGFQRFMEHIGPKPSDNHSLDRIDNDGNYEPGNVRWATKEEQNNNKG